MCPPRKRQSAGDKCVEWQERVSQKLGEPLKPRSWTEWGSPRGCLHVGPIDRLDWHSHLAALQSLHDLINAEARRLLSRRKLLEGRDESPAAAGEKGLANKGEALVRKNCSRCHAIGKEGDGPTASASLPHAISKYPVKSLQNRWRGHCPWSSRHPDLRVWPAGRGSDHRVSETIQTK